MRVALAARICHALGGGSSPGDAGYAGLEYMKQRTASRGGVIVIDRDGRIGWARSTHSMAYAASWTHHKVVAGG